MIIYIKAKYCVLFRLKCSIQWFKRFFTLINDLAKNEHASSSLKGLLSEVFFPLRATTPKVKLDHKAKDSYLIAVLDTLEQLSDINRRHNTQQIIKK